MTSGRIGWTSFRQPSRRPVEPGCERSACQQQNHGRRIAAFESLIRKQEEANRAEGFANPRGIRTAWESRSAQFLGTIEGWLRGSSVCKLIHIEPFEEAVFDGSIGRFKAQGMVLTIPSGQTFIIKITAHCRAQVSPTDVGRAVELVCKEDSGEWFVPGLDGRAFDKGSARS